MNDRLFDVDSAGRAELRRVLTTALASEPAIVFAYLHGSFAGNRPFHDIDIAVYLSQAAADHTRLSIAMADRLSRRAGRPVDVRVLNAVPVTFFFRAVQGELLVCHDDQRLMELLEYTGRRYLDLAPVLRRATRDAFAS